MDKDRVRERKMGKEGKEKRREGNGRDRKGKG